MREEFSRFVLDREIFLMVAHHRDQNFFRQFEELGIKAAQNRGRKFREVHDRSQKRVVVAPACAGDGTGSGIERFADRMFAFGGAQNSYSAQGLNVGAGLGDDDVFTTKDAMSARCLAGADPEDLHWDHLFVEQRDQPPYRTNKHFTTLAPVHILRPVKRCDLFR